MNTSVKDRPDTRTRGQDVLWDNVKTILYALALAFLIRFAFAQPFRIPSGSMQPTLLVGDYIVVTKWSYGYSRFSTAPFTFLPDGRIFGSAPKRGDVAVFRPTHQQDKDFIKRVIGLPGDRIQMRDGALYINDQPVKREYLGKRRFVDQSGLPTEIDTYVETLPNGVSFTTFDKEASGLVDNTSVFEVPQGHYFMMGDDRDNSDDSRASVGFVPFDHFVGKAQFVALSFDHRTTIFQPWTLFTGFRTDRFFHGVK
jgi:signal peptidase I